MNKKVKKSGGGYESANTFRLGNKTLRQTERAKRIKGRAVKKMGKAGKAGITPKQTVKRVNRAVSADAKAKKVLDKAKATYAKYIKNKKLDAKEMAAYNKKKGSTALGSVSKKGRKRLNKKT